MDNEKKTGVRQKDARRSGRAAYPAIVLLGGCLDGRFLQDVERALETGVVCCLVAGDHLVVALDSPALHPALYDDAVDLGCALGLNDMDQRGEERSFPAAKL